jgi:uncharacterized protein YceK
MRVLLMCLIFLSCGLLTGCNSTNLFASYDDANNQYANTCCNDENYQSGYYYNGYKENGWRYCVVKAK